MKRLIISAVLLITGSSYAHDHCAISKVYFQHVSDGKLADNANLKKAFGEKGLRRLKSKNYQLKSEAHKSLIIETDCKNNKDDGWFYTECKAKVKIYCEKENKVEAIAERFFTSSAEINHDRLASKIMLKAVHGLPKCKEHEH